MSKNEKIIHEYEELKNKINLWNKAYFDYDDPIVEDHIYDANLEKLKNYELKYSYLNIFDSPTQKA